MNLRDLHYVLAVADTLSFKKAANLCAVSQPTLSMQIRKVEDYLGVRLFERTNKTVMLTAAGAQIADIARHMLDDEKRIHEVARALGDPEGGVFRLGAFPTLASYVFPKIVPALLGKFPKLELLLVEDKTTVLLEKLRSGEVDAALLAFPVDDPQFAVTPLFEDPFLLAVGPDHPLAKRKSARLSDLSGHRLLLLDEGHCLRDQALDICRAHGAYEERSFRATSLETLRLMVGAPHCGFMTLMPRLAVHARDGLRYIPFAGAKPSRTIALVARKSDARVALLGKMAQLLKSGYLSP